MPWGTAPGPGQAVRAGDEAAPGPGQAVRPPWGTAPGPGQAVRGAMERGLSAGLCQVCGTLFEAPPNPTNPLNDRRWPLRGGASKAVPGGPFRRGKHSLSPWKPWKARGFPPFPLCQGVSHRCTNGWGRWPPQTPPGLGHGLALSFKNLSLWTSGALRAKQPPTR